MLKPGLGYHNYVCLGFVYHDDKLSEFARSVDGPDIDRHDFDQFFLLEIVIV